MVWWPSSGYITHPRPLMSLIPICPHYDTFLLAGASLFTNAVILWTVAVDVTWKHQCDNELPPSGCRPWARYPTGPTGLQKSQDFSPPQAFQDSPVSFSSNFQESRPAEPPQINQLLKIMHLLLWMLSYIFFSYQQEKISTSTGEIAKFHKMCSIISSY